MPLENQKQRFRTRGGRKINQKSTKGNFGPPPIQNRSKMGPEICPKSNGMAVIDFWSIFDRFEDPLSYGIAVFGFPRAPMSARFLVNFWMDFGWRNLDQSNPYRGKWPFLVFQWYRFVDRSITSQSKSIQKSINKSISLENQKRPFSSIGVALITILPSKIDPEIDPKSSQNRCPWKTKNSDSVREGSQNLSKTQQKSIKIYENRSKIGLKIDQKSIKNRFILRPHFGTKTLTSAWEVLTFLGTCLSMNGKRV